MFFGVFEQKSSILPVYKVNVIGDKNNADEDKLRSSSYLEVNLTKNLQIPEEEKMHHPSSKIE